MTELRREADEDAWGSERPHGERHAVEDVIERYEADDVVAPATFPRRAFLGW